MSFGKADFQVFKNALVYTVAVTAVAKLVDDREGSVLTLLATAAILTVGAQVATDELGKTKTESDLIRPIVAAGAFVCSTLVAVGINMQSTLLGSYLGAMFAAGDHPMLVLGASAVGLVMLWVLGEATGANPN